MCVLYIVNRTPGRQMFISHFIGYKTYIKNDSLLSQNTIKNV